MTGVLGCLVLMFTGITLGVMAVDRFAEGARRKLFVGLAWLLLVIGMRILFLDNAVVWPVYFKNLVPQEEITWRQNNCILNQIKIRTGRIKKDSPYFALGSSQVNALFGKPEMIPQMGMSAISCSEYSFFRREILLKRPRTVILYLSEFDMTTGYNLGGIKYLPEDPGSLFSFLRRYVSIGKKGWDKRFNEASLVAYENLVPEVKYGFLLRSLLNKLLKITSPELEKEKNFSQKRHAARDEAEFQKAITNSEAKRFLGMAYLEQHWQALEEFLALLEKEGIRVVILEGQYYPPIMSLDVAVKANHVFREGMLPIVRRHANTRFIPREEQFLFSAGDYGPRDWVHVEVEPARRYNEYLFRYLSGSFTDDTPGGAVVAGANDQKNVLLGKGL